MSSSTAATASARLIDASLNVRQHEISSNLVLDLHGYTKDRAIEYLHFFFNKIRYNERKRGSQTQNQITALVITGSGKHSDHGPVLRHAIKQTLSKRGMSFQLNQGQGSFNVNVMSGIDVHYLPDQQLQEDTKVIVKSSSSHSESVQLVNRPVHVGVGSDMADPPLTSVSAHDSSTSAQNSFNSSQDSDDKIYEYAHDPLPCEVAKEDDMLRQAKETSQSEASKQQSQQMREERLIEKAEFLSLELQKKIQVEEQQLIEEILEQSIHDQKHLDLKDEMALKFAIELSQNMEMKNERCARKEEEQERLQFEQALKLSVEDGSREIENSDEDRMLEEALAQSLVDSFIHTASY